MTVVYRFVIESYQRFIIADFPIESAFVIFYANDRINLSQNKILKLLPTSELVLDVLTKILLISRSMDHH